MSVKGIQALEAILRGPLSHVMSNGHCPYPSHYDMMIRRISEIIFRQHGANPGANRRTEATSR